MTQGLKKFGTSSVRFPTVGSGTGGILIIPNDAPGLSLGGRGHHIGGGSGPVTGVSAGFSGDVLFNVHIYPVSTATSEEVIVAQGSTSVETPDSHLNFTETPQIILSLILMHKQMVPLHLLEHLPLQQIRV